MTRPTRPTLWQRLVLPAALLLCCAASLGHPLSVSYSRFTVEGAGIAAVYRLPMDDMDLLLMLDENLDDEVELRELEAAKERLAAYVERQTAVTANGALLEPRLETVGIWHNEARFPYVEVRVAYASPATVESLRIRVGVLTDLYPDHRNLGEIDLGGNTGQFLFQHDNSWYAERTAEGAGRTAAGFVVLGIEHIVTGFDHLLFLLGLLLAGRGLRDLITIVTSFTLAHSLTLALAVLDLVNPGSVFVESAIALSIVYVGTENIVAREVRYRWLLAFFFGLVHGFGFAAILRDLLTSTEGLALSLFSFNLGVELGQVALVAAALPLILKLRGLPQRLLIVRLLSAAIAAFGLYWFIDRIS